MKRMTLTFTSLLPALLLCAGLLAACAHDAKKLGEASGKGSAPPAAQDATPLSEYLLKEDR